MSQRFAFRVDSGTRIGSGHVMRCLTLADALTARGGTCHFITRAHDGHLGQLLQDKGYGVTLLPVRDADYGPHPKAPVHAAWLGDSWTQDAAATNAVLEDMRPDWLIVDHYALDTTWEQAALKGLARLAVIDDLADRPHMADLLLDQNMGRVAGDYDRLLSESCIRLIGPTYALLRPEFAQLRPSALERRQTAQVNTLLISLGGVDKDNVTGRVLDVLKTADLPKDMTITVVMGHAAPHLAAVEAQAKEMPHRTQVLTGISNMAEILRDADLCIGAAGSSAWERCTLGLPTLMVVLADNQRPAATAMAQSGVVYDLGWHEGANFVDKLRLGLAAFRDKGSYEEAVRKSAALTDGGGVVQLSKQLIGA